MRGFLRIAQNEDAVSKELGRFECKRDSDIETFLRQQAIPYEKAHKSRTYLIVKSDSTRSMEIIGYFAVALSNIKIPDGLSKSMKKKLGFTSKTEILPCYLIGQLGKNDLYWKDIEGRLLVDQAMNILLKGRELVGGKFVIVDCKDIDSVTTFYESNGFIRVQLDSERELVQFVRFLGKS